MNYGGEPSSEFLLCACVRVRVLLWLCFVICFVGLQGDSEVFLLYLVLIFSSSSSFLLFLFPFFLHSCRTS